MNNGTQDMLSRVADSLFWMSRYLERAENTARLLDVHLNLMLDSPNELEPQQVNRLLRILSLEPQEISNDDLMRSLTFDTNNSAAIVTHITATRENARQVREQISSEMWTQINKLYLYVRSTDADYIWQSSPHDFYLQVRDGSHLFQGITDATMNHNQGWHFIQIGRFLERIFGLLTLLDVHFKDIQLSQQQQISTDRYFELVAILKSATAFEAYTKVYSPNVKPLWIIEFLLFNKEFPRSLRFCVEMIQASLISLAEMTGHARNTRLYRLTGRLQSNLSYDEISDIQDLHDYVENVKQQIYQIHDTLYDTYISYPIETAL